MKLSNLLRIALIPAALCAQEGSLTVSSPVWQGVEVQFISKVEPPDGGVGRLPGGVAPAADRAYRVIVDAAHKRFFGYNLYLEPLAGAQTVRLRFEPLTLPRLQMESFGIAEGWTQLTLPKYPAVSARVGETAALDLLVNPASGRKIVDYLTLRRSGLGGGSAGGAARDLAVADLELKLDSPRVSVNGRLVEATAQFRGGITGNVVWLYLAGHGRFVISLFPPSVPGFDKSGVLGASSLTFRDGDAEYRVDCHTEIAPATGSYNLYVHHDAGWRPRGADAVAPFLIGGADKVERLIRNQ